MYPVRSCPSLMSKFTKQSFAKNGKKRWFQLSFTDSPYFPLMLPHRNDYTKKINLVRSIISRDGQGFLEYRCGDFGLHFCSQARKATCSKSKREPSLSLSSSLPFSSRPSCSRAPTGMSTDVSCKASLLLFIAYHALHGNFCGSSADSPFMLKNAGRKTSWASQIHTCWTSLYCN